MAATSGEHVLSCPIDEINILCLHVFTHHLGTFQAHCQNQLIEELAMTALQATTLIPPAVARVIEENLPIGDEKATENTQHDAHRNVRGQFE
ncbi:hypothetical protein Y032_0082g1537 [Ancylostoma ceylanicum]|uniref:Uncharacterized protein n=1 Tax=Ancylostoma ceylanicum TaxID=53326 RepID=A0A016TRT0_9BILA|nr:hypothetical protein Y032_0082g1537 [Ancylostoma ceylanicum]